MYLLNVLNDIYCSFKTIGYVCEKDSKLVHQYLVHVDGPIKECKYMYFNPNLNGGCSTKLFSTNFKIVFDKYITTV